MTNQEWFHRTTWTNNDQDDFIAHLNKSRKSSRGQYLKFQVQNLIEEDSFIEATQKRSSDFSRHPNVGLIAESTKVVLNELLEVVEYRLTWRALGWADPPVFK